MSKFFRPALRPLALALLALCCLGVVFPAQTAHADSQEPWQWPLTPKPVISRNFEPPPQPWASGHRGVDLEAASGAAILSPADGRVLFVGTVVDRPVITVDHGNQVLSSFEPALASVEEGDVVVAGKRLGAIGSGGHCEAACLHWGVRVKGEYVDPLHFIRDRRPSILLPLPR